MQTEVGQLPNRTEAVKQRGCRKRGRQLRWDDCDKRDERKAEEVASGGRRRLIGRSGKKWREKAADREKWKTSRWRRQLIGRCGKQVEREGCR